MDTSPLPGGTVHNQVPSELMEILQNDQTLLEIWQSLTPLARNEWICWTTSAKQADTNTRRRTRMQQELHEGMRRPCCWPGCPHRHKTGAA